MIAGRGTQCTAALEASRGLAPPRLVLAGSSGAGPIDAFLCRLVGAFEAALPGRVRAYYLIGSYADGSAVPCSDLDVVVLVKGRLERADEALAWAVGDRYALRAPARLDLAIGGEDDVSWEKRHVKLASVFLYGQDIRERLVLPPTAGAQEVRDSLHYALRYLMRYLRGVERLRVPLEYPDPAAEFYGYDTVREPAWYPPGTTRGLRELVNAVTLMASALTPLPAGHHRASTKGQAVTLYRQLAGGPWADYVAAVYELAKRRWGYLLPTAPEERRRLRALCRETLGFEHHFLARYRAILPGAAPLLQGG
jgi:predicted nucleotidyltransferase